MADAIYWRRNKQGLLKIYIANQKHVDSSFFEMGERGDRRYLRGDNLVVEGAHKQNRTFWIISEMSGLIDFKW